MTNFDFNTHPFTSRLNNVKRSGSYHWMCSCPCSANHKHGDKNQSLSVAFDPMTDNVLVYCHGGCDLPSIVAAVGCSLADLTAHGNTNSLMKSISWYANKNGLRLGEIYQYGGGLFKIRFYDQDGEKTFRWIHVDDSNRFGYTWNRDGYKPRLYVAGNLKEDKTIIVTEGEKDANTVHRITGITAVSSENGATKGTAEKKWCPEYNTQLTGKDVFILYDNDEAGINFANIEAANLLGKAETVMMMDIRSVWSECPEKGDITDLAVALGDDETKKRIDQLFINATPAAPAPAELINGIEVHQAVEQPKPAAAPVTETSSKDILKHISPLSSRKHSLESLPGKEYLFKPYFPMGKFSIITADPGTGKTKVVDAIAALVTTGGSLCGIKCDRPGNVLIFSMEDDDSDHIATIAHCGGDVSKVICPNSDDDDIDYFAQNQLTFGSPEIEEAIKEYRPSLVVFDPYQKWVGGKTDTDKANKLSVALTPLTLLSKKYNCHITVIAHNIKAQTSKLQYKFMGSVDFVGEARSAMMVVKDPDKLSENENVIIHVKSNNKHGKSIRYRIDSIPGNEDYATIKWLGLDDYTERDYMLANRTALQNKIQSITEINDSDPTVSMIMDIIRENHDVKEIRIGNFDFAQCYSEYTGQYLKDQVAKEIKRVQTYLEEKHGISVISSDSRTLMSFKLRGKTYDPHTAQSRCIRIQKSVAYTPGQQTEINTNE